MVLRGSTTFLPSACKSTTVSADSDCKMPVSIAGEIETGILQSESADTVVLLQALGKKVVLPRRTIKRLESSGLSLMPEGLEIGMTPADLRDLIAFLQEKR